MLRSKQAGAWLTSWVAGAALILVGLVSGSVSSARTADGLTPAQEMVCEGLPRAEFGLCNAYCEAIDCDSRSAPLKACESLRDNYFELTGWSAFPCDATCPELPDPTCSGIGFIDLGEDGCEVCLCPESWSGPDCATCHAGFDNCGECGGNNDCEE